MYNNLRISLKIFLCLAVVMVQLVFEFSPSIKSYCQMKLCDIDIAKTLQINRTEPEDWQKLITQESIQELQKMQRASCSQLFKKYK